MILDLRFLPHWSAGIAGSPAGQRGVPSRASRLGCKPRWSASPPFLTLRLPTRMTANLLNDKHQPYALTELIKSANKP